MWATETGSKGVKAKETKKKQHRNRYFHDIFNISLLLSDVCVRALFNASTVIECFNYTLILFFFFFSYFIEIPIFKIRTQFLNHFPCINTKCLKSVTIGWIASTARWLNEGIVFPVSRLLFAIIVELATEGFVSDLYMCLCVWVCVSKNTICSPYRIFIYFLFSNI